MTIRQFLFLLCLSFSPLYGQQAVLEQHIQSFFEHYTLENYQPARAMKCESVEINDKKQQIIIYGNDSFCSQVFTPQSVKYIYRTLSQELPADYKKYDITIKSDKHIAIEDLIPNAYRKEKLDKKRLWNKKNYEGNPWVQNISKPYTVTEGLQNRHLFIWASHGRYFKEDIWKWQRPYLFCTTEDMFTQSFVYPFLFPMLENAGAVVCSPRERDYQTECIVVDNNRQYPKESYIETEGTNHWESSPDGTGFSIPPSFLNDSIFPFQSGTYRFTSSTSHRSSLSTAMWTPKITKDGKYAVYISYASMPNSIDNAHYTVHHQGGQTEFIVNQQMGGGTWVYLGTFSFASHSTKRQGVTLDNYSKNVGIVTADAARFGGGFGQIERGHIGVSGLPRYLEAARYYAHWAGVPDTLVNTSEGNNDYADDLRVRGNMLNYLGGGSVYQPGKKGQRVPFELSLALHSDAGIRQGHGIYGSLSIGTTQIEDSLKTFSSGISRKASSDLSAILLKGLEKDLTYAIHTPWILREHWDRNYAETRIPDVPSAILEMLSHQNFTDMKYGHDPIFKFTLARSVYKSILKYINVQHNIKEYCIQPLPIKNFAAELNNQGSQVRLSWDPTSDPLEPTADPTRFILYTKINNGTFDNGQDLGNCNACLVDITPDTRYAFRITAVNSGGESFPSETLSAYSKSGTSKRVLIVNGFHRLSGPAQIITPEKMGFDIEADFGVPYLTTTAFAGKQQIFETSAAGLADSITWGFSGNEWIGREFAGNTFDYPVSHGDAIAASARYSYCSVSRDAFEQPGFITSDYDAIDYIAGLEGNFRHNLRLFKTFPYSVQQKIKSYLMEGGALLLSGAYIASDCQSNMQDQTFIEQILKYQFAGNAGKDHTQTVNGLNMNFDIYRSPNENHYWVRNPDVILPSTDQAFPCFVYGQGQGAGVAYHGNDYRVLSMSFPFECIQEESVRTAAMSAILSFLTE